MSELGRIVAAKVQENEIESLFRQLTECQATNVKLRGWIEKWCKFDSLNMDLQEWFRFSAEYKALCDGANDTTALNELIAERTKEQPDFDDPTHPAFVNGYKVGFDSSYLHSQITELTAEVERLNVDLAHTEACCISWAGDVGKLSQQNAELTAQRDAAMQDAERYRFIREQSYVAVSSRKECLWIPKGIFEIPGKGFDAAIDAAIANCNNKEK